MDKPGLGKTRNPGDKAVVELATNTGRQLCDFLHWLKSIKPGHQRIVERCWDCDCIKGAIKHKSVRRIAQYARLKHGLRELFDEKWDPVRFRGDLRQEVLRQRLISRQAADDRFNLLASKAVQR